MIEKGCDLLVAGGGIAGMCAAIAAARQGLSVILINDRSVLGGNASSEIGVGISGSSHHGLNPAIYAKETGIVEELRLRLAWYQKDDGYGKAAALDAVFFDMIYAEPNITLLMNTVVTGCEVENRKITKTFARHSVNNQVFQITALSYVDATGNGTLALETGAEYRIGREGKDEYQEFWAPDRADSFTMGNSIYFETEDVGREVPFKAPDFAHDITQMDFIKDIDKPENFRGLSCYGPHWAYEYGGQVDILGDHDDTEKELRKLIYGIWDYIKNSGKYPQAKNRRLKRVFAKAGTRESRRFLGDYVLNENDIEQKVNFDDSVAMGGWPMDIHAPLGIYDSNPASNFVPVTGTYNIPFRCLYSKDIDNLMLAGRNISATHIALGSTRVMGTCGAIGQAVGTAAYIVKKYNTVPRTIYKEHMKELQELLVKNDQTILHRRDPQQEIQIVASSTCPYENKFAEGFMVLERDYMLALPVDTEMLDSVKLRLCSKEDATLCYRIYTGIHPETYLPAQLVKTGKLNLAQGLDDWVKIPISVEVGKDKKIYIVLEKNEAVLAGIAKNRPLGAVTYRMHTAESHEGKNHDSVPLSDLGDYLYLDHFYEKERNLLFKDVEPAQSVYQPQNVINGFYRPYGTPNLWMAESSCGEWISLKPNCDVERIELILNNGLDRDWGDLPRSMAKDIEITVSHENGTEVYQVKDNYKRCLTFFVNVKAVTDIKIKILDTYGEKASIYGVRID